MPLSIPLLNFCFYRIQSYWFFLDLLQILRTLTYLLMELFHKIAPLARLTHSLERRLRCSCLTICVKNGIVVELP